MSYERRIKIKQLIREQYPSAEHCYMIEIFDGMLWCRFGVEYLQMYGYNIYLPLVFEELKVNVSLFKD